MNDGGNELFLAVHRLQPLHQVPIGIAKLVDWLAGSGADRDARLDAVFAQTLEPIVGVVDKYGPVTNDFHKDGLLVSRGRDRRADRKILLRDLRELGAQSADLRTGFGQLPFESAEFHPGRGAFSAGVSTGA